MARRAKLFEKIPDGLAVIFAEKGQIYPVKFRQSPDFNYLASVSSGPREEQFEFSGAINAEGVR